MRGIYILYESDKIVYVGMSNNNMMNRLYSHGQTKQFDKAVICNVKNKSIIALIEVYLICKYKPKYNKNSKYDDELKIVIDIDSYLIDSIEFRFNNNKFTPINCISESKSFGNEELKYIESAIDDLITDGVSMDTIIPMIDELVSNEMIYDYDI